MANANKSYFTGLSQPKSLLKYALYHGVTDYTQLDQFNQYEGGYGFLHVLSIPKCLSALSSISAEYKELIDNYVHFIQFAFKGLSGIEDMQSETSEITNGNSSMQLITKVTKQSSGQISMRYHEQRGRLISKVHELYLRGIKDPDTGVKTHNGLIKQGVTEGLYSEEVFTFLYYNTDNTVRNIENAFLITNAQITNSAYADLANFERGTYDWKEVDVTYNGVILQGPTITQKAREYLDYVNKNTVWEQMKFGYAAIAKNTGKMPTSPEAGPTGTTFGANGTPSQQEVSFGTNYR